MAGRKKGHPKTGGRKTGTPNKLTVALKEAILQAANEAGGKKGLVGYLTKQAVSQPSSFLALLGRLLPLTAAGDKNSPLNTNVIVRRVIYTREPLEPEPAKEDLPTVPVPPSV
jgi:hypothetical protein